MFQRLLDGNGTKPFKEARGPRLMPAQVPACAKAAAETQRVSTARTIVLMEPLYTRTRLKSAPTNGHERKKSIVLTRAVRDKAPIFVPLGQFDRVSGPLAAQFSICYPHSEACNSGVKRFPTEAQTRSHGLASWMESRLGAASSAVPGSPDRFDPLRRVFSFRQLRIAKMARG
jgi:hypothetical protein